MRRLQASPHVILLNFYYHGFGDTVVGELVAPMAALSQLQALVFAGACPTSPLKMVGLQPQHNNNNHSSVSIPHILKAIAFGAEGCIALSSSLVHLFAFEGTASRR